MTNEIEKSEALPVVLGNCAVSQLGIEFPDSMTFAEWVEVGRRLEILENYSNFWQGDWILAGKKRGGMYDEFLQKTKKALATGWAYAWVCSSIPILRRRKISFGHHREIAALETPEEQDKYFDLC